MNLNIKPSKIQGETLISKYLSVQILIALAKLHGIRNVIISPGSRNAPLSLSFTEDKYFDCFSIVDERVAAFFGLGMALSAKKPSILVCTSGSAVLNYFPAVAEAFYSEVPLIVVSADRPPQKIDIGDGQTIRQKDVFGTHVSGSFQTGLDQLSDLPNSAVNLRNLEILNAAIESSLNTKRPVHVNMPFEEPLYELSNQKLDLIVSSKTKTSVKEAADLSSFKADLLSSKRVMIIVSDIDKPLALKLKSELEILQDVIILTEVSSKLYLENSIQSIDQLLAPIELSESASNLRASLIPDLLITIGQNIVSKKVKSFFRESEKINHWHFGKTTPRDTFFCLKGQVKDLFLGLDLLRTATHLEKSYVNNIWTLYDELQVLKEKYISTIDYSDFYAWRIISASIPEDYLIHSSNSSAIRYLQLVPPKNRNAVYCNRGTSGIDGSTSTAIGHGAASGVPTCLLTGDLSFLYDSNALWTDYTPEDFRIIVINNRGGGIFRILPGDKTKENFIRYFETRHKHNASHLCKMFDFEYKAARNENELKESLDGFWVEDGKPKLLEIFTPENLNDKILLDYFSFLKRESSLL